jgi:hypothetical protein
MCLAVVACTLGLTLHVDRESEDTATLIGSKVLRAQYDSLSARVVHLTDLSIAGKSDARDNGEVAHLSARQLLVVKRAGLRDCHRGEVLGTFECKGHRVRSTALKIAFWLMMSVGLLLLAGWLYTELGDSWILPRWPEYLWLTPPFAGCVAMLSGPPLLMMSNT